jgi:hypothetical protein
VSKTETIFFVFAFFIGTNILLLLAIKNLIPGFGQIFWNFSHQIERPPQRPHPSFANFIDYKENPSPNRTAYP